MSQIARGVYGETAWKRLSKYARQAAAEIFSTARSNTGSRTEKMELHIQSNTTDGCTNTVQLIRQVKKYVGLAIEKSKPGFFSSKEPEDVGERIQSKISDMESNFRSDTVGYACTSFNEFLTREIEEWQRIKRVISAG